MNKRIASIVVASTLGLGAAGSLSLSPALAAAAGSTVSHRASAIKDALKGLVSDGTLTQAQADKVTTTLDATLSTRKPTHKPQHQRGGHERGKRLAEVATILGVSVGDLHSALESGKSLAEVAAGKGISRATLIDKLVAAAEARIAAKVAGGQITQAQADERTSQLRDHLTTLVDRKGHFGHKAGTDV